MSNLRTTQVTTATLVTDILFCGNACRVTCDSACEKAWGINSRPRVSLSRNPDDYAFLADDEVGFAPDDPGTYEGGHGKPMHPGRHNKWCVRECERCEMHKPSETLMIRDFSKRRYNIPRKETTP